MGWLFDDVIEKLSRGFASGGDMRLAIDGNFDMFVGCIDRGRDCRDGLTSLVL